MKTLSVGEVQELFTRISDLEEEVKALGNRLAVVELLGVEPRDEGEGACACEPVIRLSPKRQEVVKYLQIRGNVSSVEEIAGGLLISFREANHRVGCLEMLGVVCVGTVDDPKKVSLRGIWRKK